MAKKQSKTTFLMYKDWIPLMKTMPREKLGDLMFAVACYQEGEPVEIEDQMVRSVFEMFKLKFDENETAYLEQCEINAQIAREREEKKKNEASRCVKNRDEEERSITYKDRDKDIDKDLKEKTTKREKFKKPTLEEVREYCLVRQNKVDPEQFIDFYESKGWKVGDQCMKDWKAAVRTWEKRDKPKGKPPDKWQPQNQRSYDYDNLERSLLARGSG